MGIRASFVKASFEKESDTPRKTRWFPESTEYLSDARCPYPLDRLESLKERARIVQVDAAYNSRYNAHEREWGGLMRGLLSEFEHWDVGAAFRIMNV